MDPGPRADAGPVSPPRRALPRRLRGSAVALAAVALAQVFLAGCGAADGKNAPLPRESKAEALRQSQDVTAGLAASAAVKVDAKPPSTQYTPCVGADGEKPTDARYQLLYYANLDVPPDLQEPADKRMRAYLTGRNYRIVGHVEASNHGSGFEIDARKNDWLVGLTSISVGEGPSNRVVVSVYSPCLLPPGAHQLEQ